MQMIDMPVRDASNLEATKILAAFQDQTIIELNGKRCMIVDFLWPKGSTDMEYKVRYLD